jgi:hypothetical protein
VWRVLGCLLLVWLPCALALAEDAPVIERVEPSAGPPGTVLTIRGRRLHGQTRVTVGETPLSIQLSTPNLLTARVEAGTASGVLRVQTAAGEVQGPEFSVTREALAPIIERVQPSRAVPGSTVVIYGRRFSQRLSQNVVQFGPAVAIITAASAEPGTAPDSGATRLTVIVPEGAGMSALRVRVLGAGDARSPQPFETLARLTIESVLPPRAAPGARIEVHGSGFDGALQLYLGTTRLRVLEQSTTRLLAVVPANAESGPVRVESKLAGRAQSVAPFEVIAPPVLSGFTPRVGPIGTQIVVAGKGFGQDVAAVRVRLGDSALIVRSVAPHELVAEVPPAAQSGKLAIQVGELGPASSATEFSLTEVLRVSDPQPPSGPAGTLVSLPGRGFAARVEDNQVSLGGVGVEVVRAAPSELSVRVPDAKSAPFSVQVGPSRVDSRQAFIVTHPPRIRSLSAEAVRVGSELSIRGAGFGQQPALVRVSLDRQALEVLSVRDDAIVVRAPLASAAGQLSVQVALQGAAVYPRPLRVVERP